MNISWFVSAATKHSPPSECEKKAPVGMTPPQKSQLCNSTSSYSPLGPALCANLAKDKIRHLDVSALLYLCKDAVNDGPAKVCYILHEGVCEYDIDAIFGCI